MQQTEFLFNGQARGLDLIIVAEDGATNGESISIMERPVILFYMQVMKMLEGVQLKVLMLLRIVVVVVVLLQIVVFCLKGQ